MSRGFGNAKEYATEVTDSTEKAIYVADRQWDSVICASVPSV
jgi:hypothetical protein